jgi:flagellar basal body-associated protein FliL
MNAFQRQLLLVVLLAGAAGFAGVWFGAHAFQTQVQTSAPLRMAVDELTRRMGGLTQAQKNQINEIEVRYARKRARLRSRIAVANSELADALVDEMTLGPKVEASIETVKSMIGDLQHETVAYVLELRAVLSEQQQMQFDEKVMSALMAPPS